MLKRNILSFFALFALPSLVNAEDRQGCVFHTHLSGSRKKGEDQIELLKGRRYWNFMGGGNILAQPSSHCKSSILLRLKVTLCKNCDG